MTAMHKPVALVTAASKGIGLACAKALAARGYALVVMSSSERIREVAEEIDATPVVGSVTEENDLRRLVQEAVGAFRRIDAVVLSTGQPPVAGVLDATDEQWRQGFDLCFHHVVRMARLVTPIMQQQGGGAIVNIAAINAVEPGDWYVSAVRAALLNYVKLYTRQAGPLGIRMNNVLPGYLENWAVEDDIVQTIPLRRAGRLEEVAQAVAFLASPEASYIAGQNIRVDGGYTRSI